MMILSLCTAWKSVCVCMVWKVHCWVFLGHRWSSHLSGMSTWIHRKDVFYLCSWIWRQPFYTRGSLSTRYMSGDSEYCMVAFYRILLFYFHFVSCHYTTLLMLCSVGQKCDSRGSLTSTPDRHTGHCSCKVFVLLRSKHLHLLILTTACTKSYWKNIITKKTLI